MLNLVCHITGGPHHYKSVKDKFNMVLDFERLYKFVVNNLYDTTNLKVVYLEETNKGTVPKSVVAIISHVSVRIRTLILVRCESAASQIIVNDLYNNIKRN